MKIHTSAARSLLFYLSQSPSSWVHALPSSLSLSLSLWFLDPCSGVRELTSVFTSVYLLTWMETRPSHLYWPLQQRPLFFMLPKYTCEKRQDSNCPWSLVAPSDHSWCRSRPHTSLHPPFHILPSIIHCSPWLSSISLWLQPAAPSFPLLFHLLGNCSVCPDDPPGSLASQFSDCHKAAGLCFHSLQSVTDILQIAYYLELLHLRDVFSNHWTA